MFKRLIVLLSLANSPYLWADSFILTAENIDKTITTQDLEQLPSSRITTSTNFTPTAQFEGVPFSSFMATYKITATSLRVFALDDYSYTLPVAELLKYNVILAFKKNDKAMPVSDLGPYAIIYPRDQNPELNKLEVNAKTVWQISRIEALK